MKRLFDLCIETKRNIIFECTIRAKEPITETMMRLKEAEYAVEVHVMAAHARHTVLGASMRFEGQSAVKGHGRAVPRHVHDEASRAMPKTVGYIQERRLCDRLCVNNIDHDKIYDNRLESGRWTHEGKVESVIYEIRSLPFPCQQKNHTPTMPRVCCL